MGASAKSGLFVDIIHHLPRGDIAVFIARADVGGNGKLICFLAVIVEADGEIGGATVVEFLRDDVEVVEGDGVG